MKPRSSLFGLAAVAGVTLATISATSAAIVFVTVTGTSVLVIPNGQTYPTELLGNGHFTANFSYDDSTAYNPATTLYENALKSFSMTFTDGSGLFTATGGGIQATSGAFQIRSLSGAGFPMLAGMAYSNLILFKFISSGTVPTDRLPTAVELNSGYAPWYTWIAYNNNPNGFTLVQQSFTAVPEPMAPILSLAALGLAFRRQRH